MKNIVVTGANGFVGRRLVDDLLELGYVVYGVTRMPMDLKKHNFHNVVMQNLNETEFWSELLVDKDCVIHLAARVHQMKDQSINPWEEYKKINCDLTLNIAEIAAEKNVAKFIFISSIKVNGEETKEKYNEDSVPRPVDYYGKSKLMAENGLQKLSYRTQMKIVVLRPPLVYGEGVKANFLSLIKLTEKAPVLPFKNIPNKRSMIYVGNLIDLIIKSLEIEKKYSLFLVSDGMALSTTRLIKEISSALDKKLILFYVPNGLFYLVGKLTGTQQQFQRLLGSLELDSTKLKEELNWTPKFTIQEAINKTVSFYLNEKKE